MATQTPTWRRRAVLAADAGLLTAAAAGLALEPGGLDPGAFDFFGSVLLWVGIGALILGPLLVWVLHGRHIDGPATAGAAGGFVLAAVVVAGVVVLAGLVFGFANASVPGPLVAVAAFAAAAYLAAAVWLDVDALRDLRRERRHVPLDAVRLLATAAYVVVVAEVVAWALGSPLPDWPERVPILLFLAAPGAIGATAAAVADLVTTDDERRSRAQPVPGA